MQKPPALLVLPLDSLASGMRSKMRLDVFLGLPDSSIVIR